MPETTLGTLDPEERGRAPIRTPLSAIALLTLVLWGCGEPPPSDPVAADMLFLGATLHDGTGAEGRGADLAAAG